MKTKHVTPSAVLMPAVATAVVAILTAALTAAMLTAILVDELAAESADEFPVRARTVTTSGAGVELKNVGTQAVTAWSFAVVSPNPRGGLHREVHSADVYLAEVTRGLPRSDEHLDWLRPGESRVVPVDAVPEGAEVEVVAVILDDRTAIGDAPTIKSFFEHRASERDELRGVVGIFKTVLPQQHGIAALEALKAQLARRAADESVPHRSAREAVDTYLAQAKAAGAVGGDAAEQEADQRIRLYATFVDRQYELAVRHATPARLQGR